LREKVTFVVLESPLPMRSIYVTP